MLKRKSRSPSEKDGQKFLADSLRRYGGLDTSHTGSMFHDDLRYMVLQQEEEEERVTPGVHPFSAPPAADNNDYCLTSKAGRDLFFLK